MAQNETYYLPLLYFPQVYDYFDKYTFLCEMFDEEADEIRELALNYFPYDKSVQVVDTVRGKVLLRRTVIPTLTVKKLQIGNIVNIFGKLLKLIDCAPATRRTLFKGYQSTFALIKPIPASEHGKVITFMMKKGFRITNLKNGKLDKDSASKLYEHLSGISAMPLIVDYVTSGEVIGLELVAEDAVKYWKKCLGATDPAAAEPGTLRALYGTSVLHNVAHAAHSDEDAKTMIDYFFGYENGVPKNPFKATLTDCTCCVILPHVLDDENLGAILEYINLSGKFIISSMAMFSVGLTDALEFYELYKGVLPQYEKMAIHLAEGQCVCLEIKAKDSSIEVVNEFKKLCGPRDPDICRQLYPDCLRALYGKDMIHNAVHCTELPEDGEQEIEYFFRLLAIKPS